MNIGIQLSSLVRPVSQKWFSTTSSLWKVQSIKKFDEFASEVSEDVPKAAKYTTKYWNRLPKREPFAKNLFLGKVDVDFLAYPEPVSVDNTEALLELRKKYKILGQSPITKQRLRDSGCYGINILQTFGGGEHTLTESLVALEELRDPNAAILVSGHQHVCEVIQTIGTETQQQKYLARLSSGECEAAVAIFENDILEHGHFNTSATWSDEENCWVLTGQKSFIVDAGDASVFLVFAHTQIKDKIGDNINTCTAFLVDANQTGVQKTSAEHKFGFAQVPQSGVTFQNIKLGQEAIVGETGSGSDIACKILRSKRLKNSLVALLCMQRMIDELKTYSKKTKHLGVSMMDMELNKKRIAKSSANCYALSSMLYFTSSLTDMYDDQDVELESSLVQSFAFKSLQQLASIALQFMGPSTLLEGSEIRNQFTDAHHLVTEGESPDSLSMLIALTGLQHTGMKIYETVKKVRNPLMNPAYILSRLLERQSIANPKLSTYLEHNVHPSLGPAAQWTEKSIIRLQIATEVMLSRFGQEIFSKQIELERLAECATLIFAMFTIISRASRAYCIGLQNAEFDVLIANAFCMDAHDVVHKKTADIEKGELLTTDAHYLKIAEQDFNTLTDLSDHPLARNY